MSLTFASCVCYNVHEANDNRGGENLVDTLELKKRRCSQGYFTQGQMADAMGMKRANYGNRERGLTPFSAEEIVKMCALLGMSLSEGMTILL